MPEQYDFKDGNDESTFFNHLLLESEVSKLTASEFFDSGDMTIRLEINGVDVRVEDFNDILEGWGKRIEEQVKSEIEYISKDKTTLQNAQILLDDKLGKAREILEAIEDMGSDLL